MSSTNDRPCPSDPLAGVPLTLWTSVRSAALCVVVLWHWVFATVRWDQHGPHSGNPLHLVPGGFVLTWFLQVMPLFFLVGGFVSNGSLRRHIARDGTSRGWVAKRARRLALPVLPLAGALVAAKLLLSPWAFGVVLLAVSPLWFLGVYLPLTMATPLLVRLARRPVVALSLSMIGVVATQLLRFAFHVGGIAVVVASFLFVWGTVYQIGFQLGVLHRSRRLAAASVVVGVVGMATCWALGYPVSMVAVKGDAISNMGPPTLPIVFLSLFQAGLVTSFAPLLGRIFGRRSVCRFLGMVDANQMRIYAIHLPIWVGSLLALRSTHIALESSPTWLWLVHRPVWLVVPAALLWLALPHTGRRVAVAAA